MTSLQVNINQVPIGAPTTVSLIDTLLPSSERTERVCLDKNTRLNTQINKNGDQAKLKLQYQTNIKIGQVFLLIAEETARFYSESRYKEFDALVRNFGCEMIALEVAQLVSLDSPERQTLLAEAVRIQQNVRPLLNRCKEKWNSPDPGQNGMLLADYLRNTLSIDMEISPNFARLARLRMLCIINKVDTCETQVINLRDKVSEGRTMPNGLLENLQLIVAGIQADESRQAARFIRTQAESLTGRKQSLCRLLSADFDAQMRASNPARKSSIVTQPLLQRVEVVFRRFSGVVLVKNQVKINGFSPCERQPNRVYVLMPSSRVLTKEQVEELDKRTPLVIAEGRLNDREKLIAAINTIGLVKILLASCVTEVKRTVIGDVEQITLGKMPSYSPGTPPMETRTYDCDVEAQKEIAAIRNGQNPTYTSEKIACEIFALDHVYCSSVNEEALI
jgi:hypothetical protein